MHLLKNDNKIINQTHLNNNKYQHIDKNQFSRKSLNRSIENMLYCMVKSEYTMKICFIYYTHSDKVQTRYQQRLQVDSRSRILLIKETT